MHLEVWRVYWKNIFNDIFKISWDDSINIIVAIYSIGFFIIEEENNHIYTL